MGVRKEYTVNDARIPEFTIRFRQKVDELGGVKKVSELSGISRPTLNFWYNGQRTPDAVSLITLSRCFSVTSDWLLGLRDPDNPTDNIELAAVSNMTGLSNAAVNQLQAMAEGEYAGNVKFCELRAINYLLEKSPGFFVELYDYLFGTVTNVSVTDGKREVFSDKMTIWNDPKDGSKIGTEVEAADLEAWRLVKIQQELLELKRAIREEG